MAEKAENVKMKNLCLLRVDGVLGYGINMHSHLSIIRIAI